MTRPAVSSTASSQCRRSAAPGLIPRSPAFPRPTARRPARPRPVSCALGGAAGASARTADWPSAVERSRMKVILAGGYRVAPPGSLTGRGAVPLRKAGTLVTERGRRRRCLGGDLLPGRPAAAPGQVAEDDGDAKSAGRNQGNQCGELVAPAELEYVRAEQHPGGGQEGEEAGRGGRAPGRSGAPAHHAQAAEQAGRSREQEQRAGRVPTVQLVVAQERGDGLAYHWVPAAQGLAHPKDLQRTRRGGLPEP